MKAQCISSNRDFILYVLEKETGKRSVKGPAPDFLCTAGNYSLTRDGFILAPDDSDDVLVTLSELGLCDYPYVPDPPEDSTIVFPTERQTGQTLLNLFCILSARQNLINRALAAKDAFFVSPNLMKNLLAHPPSTKEEFLQALYNEQTGYKGILICSAWISFPGFKDAPLEEIHIHYQLTEKIINTALSRQWIKPFTGNPRNKKYAFRTFLNEIGMIGPEYEDARRVMLARLPGRADQRKIPRK